MWKVTRSDVFIGCLQPLDLIQYDSWNVILPEGEFLTKVSRASFSACCWHPLLHNCRGCLSAVRWANSKQLLHVLMSSRDKHQWTMAVSMLTGTCGLQASVQTDAV